MVGLSPKATAGEDFYLAYLLSDLRHRMILRLFLFVGLIVCGGLYPFLGFGRSLTLAVVLSVPVLTLLVGSSGYWSPWRLLFRHAPFLQKMFMPDLNGVWVGETRSNIDRMLEDHVATEPSMAALRPTRVKFRIRHSFLGFMLEGKTEATNGDSRSVVGTIQRNGEGRWVLSYIYDQLVRDPSPTDETTHIGAAELNYTQEAPNRLEGHYWTRRMWHKGLNTAGVVELRRVSEKSMEFNPYAAEEADYDGL